MCYSRSTYKDATLKSPCLPALLSIVSFIKKLHIESSHSPLVFHVIREELLLRTTMATLPGLETIFPHPGSQVVKNTADAILDQDHATWSTTHEATDEIAFRFLHLPTELQTGIVNNVRRYSDLKALCLVSKEISDIATPRLFYKVDLKKEETEEATTEQINSLRTIAQINSLLAKPANLLYVRILKTSVLERGVTELMGRLLPFLRTDYLTDFSYATRSRSCFPTPKQIQFLLCRQRNIQNLKFFSHMTASVDDFMKRNKPRLRALFSSFTKLDINDNWTGSTANTPATMYWPLVNLDLWVLQSLHISGVRVQSFLLSCLNALFANGPFANLTKLKFSMIQFRETLTLTNMPSLTRLIFEFCKPRNHILPLVLADGFKLPYFSYSTCAHVKGLVPFLTQIRGLQHLFISAFEPVWQTDQGQADLAFAITLHKDTLRTLDLRENLNLECCINATLWDDYVVDVIGSCQNLVRLHLPIVSRKPPSYYFFLAEKFPHLVSLTIYDGINYCSGWNPGIALQLFPAFSKLEFVHFKGPGTILNNNLHLSDASYVRSWRSIALRIRPRSAEGNPLVRQ